MRSRPRTVVTIAAAITLPAQLIGAWASRSLFSEFNLDSFDPQTGQFEGQEDFTGLGIWQNGNWFSTVLQFVVLAFLGVALTHLVAGWRAGVDRTAKECLVFTARRAHLILTVFVMAKVLQAVSLMALTPMVMFAAPVLAAEGLGPIATIKRSFALGRRRYWQLVPLLLLIVLIHVLLTYPLLTLPTLGALLLGSWGWIVYFILGSVGTVALSMLGVGAAVLGYFDTIDRTEGTALRDRIAAQRAQI